MLPLSTAEIADSSHVEPLSAEYFLQSMVILRMKINFHFINIEQRLEELKLSLNPREH